MTEQDLLIGEKAVEPLGLWAFDASARVNACTYYRVEVPIRGLLGMGYAEGVIDNGLGKRENTINAMVNADIDLLYANGDDSETGPAHVVRNMKAGHDGEGNAIFPPSLVFDLDDNIDYIHPFNPAFARMGVRAADGSLLGPGDNLTTIMPDGREITAWQDGVTEDDEGHVFDITANKARVKGVHNVARMCHGVTVPSEMLARYYREIHQCKRVYVFPNTVMESDYWFPNLAPRTDGSVRILWQGGQSHMGDWWPLRDALRETAKKYPQAKFVVWGTRYPWIMNVIPPEQVEYHQWLDYSAYKIKRGGLDCDINLAPLANNVFNRCKSGIKWYEGSIGPRPEATLASNVAPYAQEMTDGVNGLLYSTPEEFAQKLGTLIENADKRRELAENAREWVRANRSPQATIPGLYEFYRELRAVRRSEFLGE